MKLHAEHMSLSTAAEKLPPYSQHATVAAANGRTKGMREINER